MRKGLQEGGTGAATLSWCRRVQVGAWLTVVILIIQRSVGDKLLSKRTAIL